MIPGGFFGVDVFFVISGYLISGIIFRGLIDGSFSYRTFYERRIRRVLPNLLLVLAFVSILGLFFLTSKELLTLGKHIYSSAAFSQNFRLLKEGGYFVEDSLRKPLLHLWSLAIEEQFYIVFPILCVLIWKFSKPKTKITAFVLLITLGSIAACLLLRDRDFNFYFPLTRFWELGAGIILSLCETYGLWKEDRLPVWLRNTLSVIGILFILSAMVFFKRSWTHPGLITFIPVIGSVFLIAAGPGALMNRSLLSWRVMNFVGLISYSLYLWHWPLLAYLFIIIPKTPPYYIAIALALSFLISSAVYFFVENPARKSQTLFGFSTVKLLMIGLAIMGALGYVFKATKGLPGRKLSFPSEVNNVRAVNEWKAFNDAPKFKYEKTDIAVTGKKEIPSILFAGDSHVAQYFSRIKYLSEKNGINAGMLAKGGTYILEPRPNGKHSDIKLTNAFYKLISDKRVKTLVIGQMWGAYMKKENFSRGMEKIKSAMMKRHDLRVFVLLDPPWTPGNSNGQQGDYDPLRHLNRLYFDRNAFIVPYPDNDTWKKGNDAVIKSLGGVTTIISVKEYICPNQKCNLLEWYRDDDHLQPRRVEKDGIWIDQVFEKAHPSPQK